MSDRERIRKLQEQLAQAEGIIHALRTHEVDAIVGKDDVALVHSRKVDEARGLLAAIVESSGDGIISMDLDGRAMSWNTGAERLLGYRSDEMIGQPIALLVPSELQTEEAGMLKRLRCGETIGDYETVRLAKDGHRIPVSLTLSPIRDAAGNIIGAAKIVRDITERKRAEAELQRVNALLDTLLQTAPIGFCFLDRDLRFGRINKRLAEINGISVEAHLGRHISEIVPTLFDTLRAVTGRILATGDAVLNHEFSGDTNAAPGMTRFWNESWYPVRGGAGEVMGFGAIIEDITARKQAEAALSEINATLEQRVTERTAQLTEVNRVLESEIARRQQAEAGRQQVLRWLNEAEETERGRISRELHDQLGQDLTALKLGLQRLQQQTPNDADIQRNFAALYKLNDGLMRTIHRLAWELPPAVLDDLGLATALRRYTSEWMKQCDVAVDLHCGGWEADRLPLEFETALYRVTQEALTNVLRHAKAQRVSVLLERRASHVSLIVDDNGVGFGAETARQKSGIRNRLGLLGMQERIRLVGGTLDIESTLERGTTVFVRIPLKTQTAVEHPK